MHGEYGCKTCVGCEKPIATARRPHPLRSGARNFFDAELVWQAKSGWIMVNIKNEKIMQEDGDRSLDQQVAEGNELFKIGRWQEAFNVADDIVKNFPDSSSAWLLHGLTRGIFNRLTDALGSFNQSLHYNDNAKSHRYKGLALWLLGRKQEALVEYEAATASDPSYVEAHSLLARRLVELGRVEEAIARAGSIENVAGQVAYRRGLGDRLRELGRVEEALAQYEAVTGLVPEEEASSRAVAETLVELGRVEEAIARAGSIENVAGQVAYRRGLGDRLR
ncbi:tetratricopeptide repeat protein, partial [Kocuria sp. NPDC057446]|uniref:tetratricopeptide repeat protein n=1 Tax=Kocuria sp. NPDC057446 TaxID=3346137 RepID=UPI003695150D